jgi:riboflavin synthase
MFTGIVEKKLAVKGYEYNSDIATLTLTRDGFDLSECPIGASIAVNGVCLTLTSFDDDIMGFDIVQSTMDKTNLSTLKIGDHVNVEKSMVVGDRNSGHELSGHVDFKAEIISSVNNGDSFQIEMAIPKAQMRYFFPQGFIAVNGISLTIADIDKDKNTIGLWIIPETARVTNICDIAIGNHVNIEVERKTQVMVDTIHDAVKEYLRDENPEKLQKISRNLIN